MEKTLTSCLRNEKILIQHIRKSSIYDKTGNPASGGFHEKSILLLPAPMGVDGSYKKILTDDELEFLQTVTDSDISFKNKEFWQTVKVPLMKEGLKLDLSIPLDFIQYKIVEAWSNPDIVKAQQVIICPSPDKITHSKSYKFVIVKPDEVAASKRQNFDKKKAAYMLIGKFENNRDILKYLYWETTLDKRIATDSFKTNDLISYFDNLIENNPGKFAVKAGDKLLETKAMLFNCWQEGILKMENKDLYFQGTKLADSDNIATIDEAASYIKNPVRQNLMLSIEGALTELRDK